MSAVLIFDVAGEKMTLPLSKITEVVALPRLTPVPRTPEHFRGLMNLRGAIIPVVDLRTKLGKEAKIDRETTVLVLSGTGVIVDSVERVGQAGGAFPELNIDEVLR